MSNGGCSHGVNGDVSGSYLRNGIAALFYIELKPVRYLRSVAILQVV